MYTSIHLLASPIHLFASAMHLLASSIRCDSVCTFSHNRKIARFKTLKNKIDELTDMIDFCEFPSLSLESLLILQCNIYAIFMKKINQVQVWMNYDIARMLTETLTLFLYSSKT